MLRFSRLSFEQTAALTRATFPGSERVQFAMRRAGGRVLVSGPVDLTTVPVDKADFQLKMSFPGRIVEANGESDAGTVELDVHPGRGRRRQRDHRVSPTRTRPSVPNWTIGLGTSWRSRRSSSWLAARRTRNPPVSPPVR